MKVLEHGCVNASLPRIGVFEIFVDDSFELYRECSCIIMTFIIGNPCNRDGSMLLEDTGS